MSETLDAETRDELGADESRVLYVDAKGEPRSLRGFVSYESDFVVIRRRSIILRIPKGRILEIKENISPGIEGAVG